MNLFALALGLILALSLDVVQAEAGRSMRQDGPGAANLGLDQGYPSCRRNLVERKCRVGTWSGGDEFRPRGAQIFPSSHPLTLSDVEVATTITWNWIGQTLTVEDYLNQAQLTGLLVLHKARIVEEHYQYDRQPDMPMRSFSMAKTFTAMLIGIAHGKGHIRSLDDKVSDYWPEIAQSAYGQTTIRNLLRMSSGVQFKELYTWTPDDDIFVWGQLLNHPRNAGKVADIHAYLNKKTSRQQEQGQKFRYASIETDILGRVLLKATGKTATELTQKWIWEPMGAEHNAHWVLASNDSGEGFAGGFNATLRDYGRFGILLSANGRRGDVQVIPEAYVLDATDANRQPPPFRPKVATPYFGYGYQTWILPFATRTFALQGIHGQTVFVQPSSQIVMVQTAVYDKASGRQDPTPYRMRHAFFNGVLGSLGGAVD